MLILVPGRGSTSERVACTDVEGLLSHSPSAFSGILEFMVEEPLSRVVWLPEAASFAFSDRLGDLMGGILVPVVVLEAPPAGFTSGSGLGSIVCIVF